MNAYVKLFLLAILLCGMLIMPVNADPPIANISANTTTGFAPLSVQFSSTANLFNFTNDVSNQDAWTYVFKGAIERDIAVAPDGTTTADKLVQDAVLMPPGSGSNDHFVSQHVDLINDTIYTASAYIKPAGRNSTALVVHGKGSDAWNGVVFDLLNQTYGYTNIGTSEPNATISAGIVPVGSGWMRCWYTFNSWNGTIPNPYIGIFAVNGTNGVNSYESGGDGVSGVYIWGTQLENGLAPSPYAPSSNWQYKNILTYNQSTGGAGGITGFTNNTGSGGAQISVNTTKHWEGTTSIQVNTTIASGSGVASTDVWAIPNTAYNGSIYVMAPANPDTELRVYLDYEQLDGTYISQVQGPDFTAQTAWTRYYVNGTTPSNCRRIGLAVRDQGAVGGWWYIDGLQIEQGMSATPFNATNVSDNNAPATFNWSLGDNTYDNSQNPVHTYPSTGMYQVILNASNTQGYSLNTTWIEAGSFNYAANITSGISPLPVAFTSTIVGNISPSYRWDFGDGTYSTLQNPIHQFINTGTTPQTYTVSETVTGTFGSNTFTRSNYVTAYPTIPTPIFNGTPSSGNSTLTVSFVDTSASNATIAYWNWSFGDGTFTNSTTQNVTHIYTNAGMTPVYRTVALNVTNIYNGFNTTTLTNYITVNPAAPIPNFNAAPVTGTSPLTVSFIDASTTNDTLVAWSWNFGDGDTTNSTLQNPVHTYHLTGPSATSFTVSLDVTDQYGTSNTTTKSNYIAVYPAPVSGFTATPVIGLFPLTVHFNLTSPSTDNASYVNWSLGDGTVLNLTAPSTWNISHIYSSGGSYTVSETTANPGGSNTTTMTGLITVTNTTVSGFTCTPILGSFNYTTTCNVTLAQDNATSWIWSFGDTKPNAYTQNVTHTYTQMGNFTITEQAINPYWTNTTPLTNYIVVNWSPVYGTGTWIPSGIPLKIGNTYILNEQWQEAGTTVPVDCDAGGTTFSIVELGIIQPTIYPGNIGLYQAYYTPTDPGIYTWRMNCTVAGHPASDSGKISVLY